MEGLEEEQRKRTGNKERGREGKSQKDREEENQPFHFRTEH